MSSPSLRSPFSDDPVDEVSLASAPLLCVLGQVKWPAVSAVKFNFDSITRELGLQLSDRYPLVARDQEMRLVLTPEGVRPQPAGFVEKYRSACGEWTVSLGENFLSLESESYTSRADFCARFDAVARTLGVLVEIPRVERVGFRYVNRIDDEEKLRNLRNYVNGAVLGGSQVPLGGGAKMRHSLTEALYSVGSFDVLVRWAVLPPNATIDPMIAPCPKESWVLDLDVFTETPQGFTPENLTRQLSDLALTGYKFFRWCVTDEFIDIFKEAK